jgi:hypothetical protein
MFILSQSAYHSFGDQSDQNFAAATDDITTAASARDPSGNSFPVTAYLVVVSDSNCVCSNGESSPQGFPTRFRGVKPYVIYRGTGVFVC